ncbi:MAG TPA: ATP-binding protein [Burkholderiales bacterium]
MESIPGSGATGAASVLGESPGRAVLTHLFHLRSFAILTVIAVILVATRIHHVGLPVPELLPGVAALTIFNLYTWYRLRLPQAVSQRECSLQLIVDLQVLTYFLRLAGGDDNPFASLYFVPLTIAAAYLERPYSLLVMLVALADFGLLNLGYVRLAMMDGGEVPDRVRDLGVDISYLLTGSQLAFFVTRVAASSRAYAAALAAAREQQLNDRLVVGFGTLAAGAAHEMATPLSVIAVLVKELMAGRGQLQEGLETIARQVDACKRTLRYLSDTAARGLAESAGEVRLDRYLDSIAGRFRLLRPDARVHTNWELPLPVPLVHQDPTLAQSVITLLNNAADVSPRAVDMDGSLRDGMLVLEVSDRGPGIPQEIAQRLGQPFVTTKAPASGMGMGLFLAKTSIERLGGTLEFLRREGGGTRVCVTLPLVVLQG